MTEITNDLLQWLKRYGYLAEDVAVTDSSSIKAGLRRLQRFYGLNETEEFDKQTIEAMQQPRCGLPDLIQNQPKRCICPWKPNTTLRYQFDRGGIPPMRGEVGDDAVQAAVMAAFQVWANDITSRNVRFELSNVEEAYEIKITDVDLGALIVAVAVYPQPCAGTVPDNLIANNECPVRVNGHSHQWTVGRRTGCYDIKTILIHEIGHILGLGHADASEPDSVMRPTFRMEDKSLPSQKDHEFLKQLYETGNC